MVGAEQPMAAGIISRDNRKANQRLPQRAREERDKRNKETRRWRARHSSVQASQFEVCLISEAAPTGDRITLSSRARGGLVRAPNLRSRSFAFKCDYGFEIKVRPSRFAVGRTRRDSLFPLRHPLIFAVVIFFPLLFRSLLAGFPPEVVAAALQSR